MFICRAMRCGSDQLNFAPPAPPWIPDLRPLRVADELLTRAGAVPCYYPHPLRVVRLLDSRYPEKPCLMGERKKNFVI